MFSIDSVVLPTSGEKIGLELPPRLQALREHALACQQLPPPSIPEIIMADAHAWQLHTESENWLLWRARRCAARLAAMPFDMEPGELLPGKPRFREPEESEQAALQEAQRLLSTMPPYPGGDAGHFQPDYEKLFRVGVRGIQEEIGQHLQRLNLTAEQRAFYHACQIVMDAFSDFIARCGQECLAMAEKDAEGAAEWREAARICQHIATEPPRTFREALQLMFLTIIALWFGEDHSLTCPGRVDQTLWPFYQADRQAGRITPQKALELLCCLYIQLNRILWPGSAVAVMIGGRNRYGQPVANELTYLALAARWATRLVYPTVGLAWNEHTPPELMDFALQMLATGIGDPAFFNDELIPEALRDYGVSEADSYNYMNSTCVEIKICGASHIWVTAPYFNCVQGLLDVLQEVAEGQRPAPEDFEAFQEAVRENLRAKIAHAAAQLDKVWRQRAHTGCFPLASCFIADCLEKGQDFDRGGARYNWIENSFVGLANLVDSLIAVRVLVYETKKLSLPEFWQILQDNFQSHEDIRQYILHKLPHYGNNHAEADSLAREWALFLMDATEAQRIGGQRYVPGFFCWIMHERLGAETGATPDGRLAGWPLADGAGGAQGREICGPTAAIMSATAWPHRRALGGLVLNVKFPASLFRQETTRRALQHLIETYMRRGGFEIQINVVSRETLLAARAHPEQYQDLLVRVAGYSDYFVHLSDKMQEEIIARSEHIL